MTTDDPDERLPYRDDPDPDDVHTDAAEAVPSTADVADAISHLAAAVRDIAATLASIPDSTVRASLAHRFGAALHEVRDDTLRHLVLTLNQGPKQVSRETGIGVGTVALACRRRP